MHRQQPDRGGKRSLRKKWYPGEALRGILGKTSRQTIGPRNGTKTGPAAGRNSPTPKGTERTPKGRHCGRKRGEKKRCGLEPRSAAKRDKKGLGGGGKSWTGEIRPSSSCRNLDKASILILIAGDNHDFCNSRISEEAGGKAGGREQQHCTGEKARGQWRTSARPPREEAVQKKKRPESWKEKARRSKSGKERRWESWKKVKR